MIENRLYNFNPGPGILPEEVLLTLRSNLLNFQGTGIGLLEMSHRSKEFETILAEAESDFRALMGVSDQYSVLFTTGGGSTQFSMVPMNLLRKGETANYLLSGVWGEAAYEEAKKFGSVHVAGSTKDKEYRSLPLDFQLSDNCSYLHFTSNNTVIGSQYPTEPDAKGAVLVCDASSDILSRRIDVNKYGLIYAGAQKNFGPSGVTVVIIRNDLLERIPSGLPLMLDYRTYSKNKSIYNTPPVFAIYVSGLAFKWLRQIGGLPAIEKRNEEKAKVLYDALDASDFYDPFVEKNARSLMNVTFRLKDRSLEDDFIKKSTAKGLVGLKGHRLLGGLRASIYNAFPMDGVHALAEFMGDFAKSNG